MGKRRSKRRLWLGGSIVRSPGPAGGGERVERDGEPYYRIADYHAMPPFLVSVVSGYDHWLFVSSTGGLTCGRRTPDHALFPYCTDDKLHDACATTGPKTVVRVERDGGATLWQPFDAGAPVYDVERNLYKNVPGNKLVFEEINRDLGLVFRYCWSTGNRFGFVRTSVLVNRTPREVRVELLDGLRNLLPYGVERAAQAELSTLVDAYKQVEVVAGAEAALFTLGSILTDRAEPSEALKSTVVWSSGLEQPRVLLSEDQVGAFCRGENVRSEASSRGKRGAFFVHSPLTLPAHAERCWHLVADVEQGPSQTADLVDAIRREDVADSIRRDVEEGTARLRRLVGAADGFQCSADARTTGRHVSNTLCNIMRGGVFPHGYRFPRSDFLNFVRERNGPAGETVRAALDALEGPLTLHSALELAAARDDEHLARWVYEYLPLTFSRRHGDPSRPWNHFSVRPVNDDGSDRLDYQGNWRDIFQNWEALALSFPEYVESFIAKFVNASTVDGYNPYRISREGFDWEVPEPGVPWSNIGYWGDHQIVYLLRFVELSRAYHPGRLDELLSRAIFVYADVPYRIRSYAEMLEHPRDTVEYDPQRARIVVKRVGDVGEDGKLATLEDGSIHRVNLLEKLLLTALVKIGNLVPGGGIWMNTQRPEWNDANNALVGHGLSMVTLCHLRRYLHALREMLRESRATRFDVSRQPARYCREVHAILRDRSGLLEGPVDAAARKSFMDDMGAVNDRYRASAYAGVRGAKEPLEKDELLDLLGSALAFLDHSLAHGRRDDGLYHTYNLIRFGSGGFDVDPLDEMLEGQVAVLSSGYLDAPRALDLLRALRESRLYREDRKSYLLYPDREFTPFLEKNVIPSGIVKESAWIQRELRSGRRDYVERDGAGRVHFNGAFRNAKELRSALEKDSTVDAPDVDRLCDVYETVFAHRTFTGRSGSMYKYEGLGCIYWHMVSKLLLAVAETVTTAAANGSEATTLDRLRACFREIREGLGVHKSPAEYGAFPTDPYSHTPGFGGVQQPGLTGQVKEDLITRFLQLGVRVAGGDVAFEPLLLDRDEFLREPASWSYSTGGQEREEELPAGSLAFTLCGVPVVYRTADAAGLHVFGAADDAPRIVSGQRLGTALAASLFRRDGRITKLVVEFPADRLP